MMTKIDAEALALKFKDSFDKCSIPVTVWAEHFQDLDPEYARNTVKWFVQNHNHAPSVATFLSEYRRLLHANDPVQDEGVEPQQWRPYSPRHEGVHFGTYYANLLDKASRGDREAIEMVAVWEQNFAAKKPRVA